ncbi:phosphonate ABC transporter, permease protein PhnE [Variovorax arabinosiphilus]|uniref:phosphonate ABC transporter, permease protein PhnE n=1 Tax=Variovorax arabinosiphilus TaxID=3053498 RepID=UPI00257680F7|nr:MULTISPECIES: phosphonate ABC transporter, permease protein PhnE [unclassified Variovorax]MDM0122814.1 phosphonate ABC transporter, permease protein PhnE [Variovorax sp. J2L1-78]MDM0132190.1 phosphonate ABC transporter, permease protein PhnE [Variovorax sp. J2L1-63]MDM0235577.1 phosphonate ABC transporter, permease protein PhnE [Variovorax sp. J2R1-6]
MGVLLALALCFVTGQRVEMGRMAVLTGEGLLAAVGLRDTSQVSAGLAGVARSLFPIQISERTEVARIENFDRARLPLFAHIETETVHDPRLNPQTLQMEDSVEQREVLVEPIGYLTHVLAKMVETLEIAFWATLLAVAMSLPLAWFSARNYSPNVVAYGVARGMVSLCRAVPELVSALLLVLAYGFGPIAGVLALALHAAGFLGKFYAEDIETADDKPQEALRAIGAGKLKVMRFAVLPQVMPQFIAYTLYVLDRNVRMATVVGLVGAGGIGQELKGRYDMYNYSHVGTILVAIFLTVFVLDQIAARLRRRFA